jgi:hypothetical protein
VRNTTMLSDDVRTVLERVVGLIEVDHQKMGM